ncbi:hypothetical protein N9982_02265 [Akkermansiaceae bacterium]|nr:hypothetical protein [Akkermansiaceae bacterium]MDB4328827.1 hypothetical protein [Akkermansiaceae bacterium]
MSDEIERGKVVPFWQIWANPIVRRYARSRLRPVGAFSSLLVFLMIAGFIFFLARQASMSRGGMEIVDAARTPILPLLVLQGIILFMLGTGQVAGAMTAEADEGVLEYQRLAPMTPLAKVTGYLFGLPVREWVIFWATMPFSIFSMWQGQVPLGIALQLYLVFIGAGILYHLTGLLAGTVMKNRRWAFLGSIGLIFVLYTILPQIAKFGLVYLKYLTIRPVVEEFFPFLIERRAGSLVETLQELAPTARFFGMNLPQSAFTLLSQGVLILVMMTMLWRRWRRNESHLLGKVGAVGFFAWVQVALLGNALPLIESGELFPSREFGRRFGRFTGTNEYNWQPEEWEIFMMIGAFGLVSLMLIWAMSFLIIPDEEGQVRGWRRARKLGRDELSPLSDPATATPWVLAMVAIGSVGWFIFARDLVNSRWFPEFVLSPSTPIALTMVLFTGGILVQAILETKGRKFTALFILLGGVLPLMLGMIVGMKDELLPASVWLIGVSPASWAMYASQVAVPIDDMPRDVVRGIPLAFWFWQGLALLLCFWMLNLLRVTRKTIADKTK